MTALMQPQTPAKTRNPDLAVWLLSAALVIGSLGVAVNNWVHRGPTTAQVQIAKACAPVHPRITCEARLMAARKIDQRKSRP
jgi:hypothetical protein